MKISESVIIFLLVIFTKQAFANNELEEDLMSRCKATFKIMENKDIKSLLDLMPVKASEEELVHIKEMLNRKYDEWFVTYGKINNIKEGKITYKEPSEFKKEKYGAINEARVKLRIKLDKATSNTSCYFIKTSKDWYLSELP